MSGMSGAAGTGPTAEVCTNGVDDDLDTFTDCADPDCAADPSCAPQVESCTNHTDDDGDGKADCADPDCAMAAHCGTLVINEVDYDQPGLDTAEFIEIYNAGLGPVSLVGVELVLVNGVGVPTTSSTNYNTIALDSVGTLPAGGYLVVDTTATTLTGVAPGAAVLHVTPSGTSLLLNAADGADGIALYDVDADTVLDAFSYAGAVVATINGQMYQLGEGTPTSLLDDQNGTRSLIRLPNGVDTDNAATDWKQTTMPTPGSANAIAPETNCSNAMDDDDDGLTDCADPNCASQSCGANGRTCDLMAAACTCAGGSVETACGDGSDNDCDGKIDCADPDCAATAGCGTPENCSNAMDDDGDGKVDCADPDCTGDSHCVTSTLFFSEYVEGTSFNKALELYNPGATPFSLAGCAIKEFVNGAATSSNSLDISTYLGGSLAGGSTLVICNASFSAASSTLCNVLSSSPAMQFNGNDALAIVCGSTILDVIGQANGTNPGAEWGTGLTSTADNTLRRKCTIFTGDPIATDAFDPSVQWDGFATDTFAGLGSRNCP